MLGILGSGKEKRDMVGVWKQESFDPERVEIVHGDKKVVIPTRVLSSNWS
jgi:hypothetical protein